MEKSHVGAEVYYHNVSIGNSPILFSGQQKCAANHAYGPTIRPHYLIVYAVRGKGVFRARGNIYHLSPGSTFVVFPGENVFYMADAEDPWYYYWLAFSGDYLGQLLGRAGITPERPVTILPENTYLAELYENLMVFTMDSESYVDVKIISLILDIFYQYLRSANKTASLSVDAFSSPSSIHIDRAIDYICSHYSQNISVSDVASYLGITREHFYLLFKNHFAVSPSRFLRNYRLQSARILLLTTDFSVSQVAEMTGFHDYNYFSNQFRLLNGISPFRFRQASRAHVGPKDLDGNPYEGVLGH